MIAKKYYVIEFGMNKIYTESQETAFEMFKLLDAGGFIELDRKIDKDYKESFYYPAKPKWHMFPKAVDVFKDEREAELARDGYDKASSMKLIKKKKHAEGAA